MRQIEQKAKMRQIEQKAKTRQIEQKAKMRQIEQEGKDDADFAGNPGTVEAVGPGALEVLAKGKTKD